MLLIVIIIHPYTGCVRQANVMHSLLSSENVWQHYNRYVLPVLLTALFLGTSSRTPTTTQDAAIAAYYLPQYDQRRTAQQCKQLEAALDTATAAAAPPKRFSFSRKASQPPSQHAAAVEVAASAGVYTAAAMVDAANNAADTGAASTASGLQSCLQHIPACRYVLGGPTSHCIT